MKKGIVRMKKYVLLLALLVFLTGCSSNEEKSSMFTENDAVPFEIVKYEEKIAPIYESLVPHIAYAKTEGQLENLKARFRVDEFDIDMENYMAAFIVTYSNSCGISVDGVYDYKDYLAVQLLENSGDKCDKQGVPHTFVIKVDKKDYEKVQLYNGNIIKSSVEIDK